MKVIHTFREVERYKVPAVCPYDGAGLELLDEYIQKKNFFYQVVKCPNCGRTYAVRKLKEVKEEIIEEEKDE